MYLKNLTKIVELKRSNISIYLLSGLNEPPLSPRRILHPKLLENYPEFEFVNQLMSPVIDSQPGRPVHQPCLTYGPPGYIDWRNRFLGSLNVYKFGLNSPKLFFVGAFESIPGFLKRL
jgi:hypothetical protein